MPVYLTVQRFKEEYSKHVKEIHIKTVYRWLDEGNPNIKAKKDAGGRDWLIIVDEDNLLFPFLARSGKHTIVK